MKLLFITFFSLLLFRAGAQEKFYNDPNARARTLNGSFSAVSVSSGVELILSKSSINALAVSAASEEDFARLTTTVENGVLKIYVDTKGMKWVNHKKDKLKAYLSFTQLDKIMAQSGALVSADKQISAASLYLSASSGSQVNLNVKTRRLSTVASSGSLLKISGSTNLLDAKASSGSSIKGYDMTTQTCTAKSSSGSSIRITIEKELNAHASSGGQVRYKGNGVVKDINVSSGGTIKKENS
ncbi:MAG: head GIN domain-containing protein [Ferruginibacter sp.]